MREAIQGSACGYVAVSPTSTTPYCVPRIVGAERALALPWTFRFLGARNAAERVSRLGSRASAVRSGCRRTMRHMRLIVLAQPGGLCQTVQTSVGLPVAVPSLWFSTRATVSPAIASGAPSAARDKSPSRPSRTTRPCRHQPSGSCSHSLRATTVFANRRHSTARDAPPRQLWPYALSCQCGRHHAFLIG